MSQTDGITYYYFYPVLYNTLSSTTDI